MQRKVLLLVVLASAVITAQGSPQPEWPKLEEETMRHFQALLRFDTADPPGGERPAADYLKQALEKEGIPVDETTWKEIQAAAAKLKLKQETLQQLAEGR